MLRVLLCALAANVVFACSWDFLIWIPRSKSADPLYRFVKNGKAGYIDGNGNIVIPPKLERYGNYGSEFHNGLLEIAVSSGRYMDRTGKIVIDRDLYRGWDFSEGLAVAMKKGESLWGYIDTSGSFVISPRFASSRTDYVYDFSDGLAVIEVKNKFGYIDHSGEFVIKPQFLDAMGFSDGMARVVTEGPCIYFPDGACGLVNPRLVGGEGGDDRPPCKFTYIDKTGEVVRRARFDNARNFSEGLAAVRVGALWGFIDKTGSFLITPRFEDAEPFSCGLSRIQVSGLYGYADKSGAIVVTPQYKYAETFSEGYAVVGDLAGRYWYVDQRRRQTIQGQFAAASPFFKGLAHVKLIAGKSTNSVTFAYIDHSGRRVFTY
jgi:hypothetical protein